MRYVELMREVQRLQTSLVCGTIGKSVLGREIPYVQMGKGINRIIIQASIHGREYATVEIALRYIQLLRQQDLHDFCFFVIPMSNPDGVELAIGGIDSVPEDRRQWLLNINGDDDFSQFKANANGVDINTNFDARWGKGATNVTKPSSQSYIGQSPNDQPETRALVDFSLYIQPVATLSYHARGREIYYDFFASLFDRRRDKRIAQSLAQASDYKVVSMQNISAGGYKDWCIQTLGVPSFTVEILPESATFPIANQLLEEEWNKVQRLPLVLMQELM